MIELTWKQRYDALKKHYKLTDADVAAITGHKVAVIRQVVNATQREFPRWLRLAIVIHETNQKQVNVPELATKSGQPALLRSTYNRMMYQLNGGKYTTSSIVVEVPLRGAEGLPDQFVSAFFARKEGGLWWLETAVVFVEDEAPPTPPFYPVAKKPFYKRQFVIGIKTLWAGDLPLLCRIIQDEERQEYRFLTVSKPDLQRRSVQDDQRLSMTLFEKDYHQQMQETFSQIENTIISS
jgi:hypothetical protein